MPKPVIHTQELKELRKLSLIFGGNSNQLKLEFLNNLKLKSTNRPGIMSRYQEALLFLAAHPDSKELLDLANEELNKLNRISQKIMNSGSENQKISFSGSGFAGSYFIACFSHSMITWLQSNYPDATSLHSFGESDHSPQELLGLALLPSESWLIENSNLPLKKWQGIAFGPKNKESLPRILQSMEQRNLPTPLRDLLYDSLQLYISFDIHELKNAMSLLRAPRGKYFFNPEPLIKKIALGPLLNKKIPEKLELSKSEINEYIKVARFALLHLSRETDPVTYAEAEGLEVFDLDRGLSIAFFYLPPERRNAMDAYVGYMIFKNRIPCGYGGAWMLGNKAKIGLNIFPSFRGGESAFLFGQILRLYKKRFRLRYFEAEPYQIGKDNPEGIESGAFWFYYKLGFRPHQEEYKIIAQEEFNKIKADRNYKSPGSILKELANSMMFLDTFEPGTGLKHALPDSLKISEQITQLISGKFQGDRKLAVDHFISEVPKKTGIHAGTFKRKEEKGMYIALLPVLYLLISSKKNILKEDVKLLSELVRSKAAATEFNYILQTQGLLPWFRKLV